jgi:hypothetical protein
VQPLKVALHLGELRASRLHLRAAERELALLCCEGERLRRREILRRPRRRGPVEDIVAVPADDGLAAASRRTPVRRRPA